MTQRFNLQITFNELRHDTISWFSRKKDEFVGCNLISNHDCTSNYQTKKFDWTFETDLVNDNRVARMFDEFASQIKALPACETLNYFVESKENYVKPPANPRFKIVEREDIAQNVNRLWTNLNGKAGQDEVTSLKERITELETANRKLKKIVSELYPRVGKLEGLPNSECYLDWSKSNETR